MKMLLKNKGWIPILFCTAVLLLFAGCEKALGCTYTEAIQSDWGNYPMDKVEAILQEDISQPSILAPNQKESMLIGNMRNFYSDFDKVSGGVKYEALCAISALETGHFSSQLCQVYNNVGGLCGSDGYMVFESKEAGIRALAELLSDEYLDPDGAYYEGTTILDVSEHYNPSVNFVNLYVKIRIDMESRIAGIEPIYPEPEPEPEPPCDLCGEVHEETLCDVTKLVPIKIESNEVMIWKF